MSPVCKYPDVPAVCLSAWFEKPGRLRPASRRYWDVQSRMWARLRVRLPGGHGFNVETGRQTEVPREPEPELSLKPHGMFLSGAHLDGYPPMADNGAKWS